MARSEAVERRIVELGLDKEALTKGLQNALKDLSKFQLKVQSFKSDGIEKVGITAENVGTKLSNLASKLPILGSIKDAITGVGKSADGSSSSLSKLNQNGNMSNIVSSSGGAAKAVSSIGEATAGVAQQFSILEMAAGVALGSILTKAMSTATQFLNKWTLKPVIDGYQEYERELDSTRVLVGALGDSEMDHITAVMRNLEDYAKTTRYSSQEMNAALAQFVNAGIDIDQAGTALKGWGNLAASASASTADFNRTLTTSVEQALQMGYMNLQNWRQIQNANMATDKFKRKIIEIAMAQGDVTGEVQATIASYGELNTEAMNYLYNDRLTEGRWLNNDVMMSALTEFANDPEMMESATKLYTFKEALEATEEAVSDSWSKFWVEMVGKGDEAVAIWTPVGEIMADMVSFIPKTMTSIAEVFNALDGRMVIVETFKSLWSVLTSIFKQFTTAFHNIFPDAQDSIAINFIELWQKIGDKIRSATLNSDALYQVFELLWRVVKLGINVVGVLTKVLAFLIPDNLVQNVVLFAGHIANLINTIFEYVSKVGSWVNTSPLMDMFRSLDATVSIFYDTLTTLFTALYSGVRTITGVMEPLVSATTGVIGTVIGGILGFGKPVRELDKDYKSLSTRFLEFNDGLRNSFSTFNDTYNNTKSLTSAFAAFGYSVMKIDPDNRLLTWFGKNIAAMFDLSKGYFDTNTNLEQFVKNQNPIATRIANIIKGWRLLKEHTVELTQAFTDFANRRLEFNWMENLYLLADRIATIFDGRLGSDTLLNMVKSFTGIDGRISVVNGRLVQMHSLGTGLNSIFGGLRTVATFAFDSIKKVLEIIGNIFITLMEYVPALLQPVYLLLELLGLIPDLLIVIFNSVTKTLTGFDSFWDNIKNFFSFLDGIKINPLFGSTVYAEDIGGATTELEKSFNPLVSLLDLLTLIAGALVLGTSHLINFVNEVIKSGQPLTTLSEGIHNLFSLKRLFSGVQSIGSSLSKFFNFSGFIRGLKGTATEADKAQFKMVALGNFLSTTFGINYESAADVLSQFGNNVKEAFSDIPGTLSRIGRAFKNFFSDLDFSSKGMFIKSIIDKLSTWFSNLGTTIGSVSDTIGKVFSKIGEILKTFGEGLNASSTVKIGTLLLFFQMFKNFGGITSILDKLLHPLKTIKEFIGSFGGNTSILDTLKTTLVSYQKQIKANTLITIANAVAILVGSLFVLAMIPTDKLVPAVTALAAVVTILVGAYSMMKFASSRWSAKGSNNASGLIDQIIEGMGFPEAKKLMKKIGTATLLISLATSLLLIIKPFKEIAAMDWDSILKGVAGLGLVILELTGGAFLAGLSKSNMGTAATILMLSMAIKNMVDMIKIINEVDNRDFEKANDRILAMALIIAAAVALMSGEFSAFGMVDIKWGDVGLGTAATVWTLIDGIKKLIGEFEVIAKIDPKVIDTGINTIERIANSLSRAIALMSGTLMIGTGAAGQVKVGGKTLFSGIPALGISGSFGAQKWSTVGALAALIFGIKMLTDEVVKLSDIDEAALDKGVSVIERIANKLGIIVALIGAKFSLNLGVAPGGTAAKGAEISTGNMGWGTALGMAAFVFGIKALCSEVGKLAEINTADLEKGTDVIVKIAWTIGIIFKIMSTDLNFGGGSGSKAGYLGLSSTSMSMPQVLGLAALIGGLILISGSIIELSKVPTEKLQNGQNAMLIVAGCITVLYTVMQGFALAFSKVEKSTKGVVMALINLVAVVGAIYIISEEFMKLSSLSTKQVRNASNALNAIAFTLTALFLVVNVVAMLMGETNPLAVIEVLATLVVVTGSLYVLSEAFVKLGGMSTSSINNAKVAMSSIALILGEMVIFIDGLGMLVGAAAMVIPLGLVGIPEVIASVMGAAQAIATLSDPFIALGNMTTGGISKAKQAITIIKDVLQEMTTSGILESFLGNAQYDLTKAEASIKTVEAIKSLGDAMKDLALTPIKTYQDAKGAIRVIKETLDEVMPQSGSIFQFGFYDANKAEASKNTVTALADLGDLMRRLGDASVESFVNAKNVINVIKEVLDELPTAGFWESLFGNPDYDAKKSEAAVTTIKSISAIGEEIRPLGDQSLDVYNNAKNIALAINDVLLAITSSGILESWFKRTSYDAKKADGALDTIKIVKKIGDQMIKIGDSPLSAYETARQSVQQIKDTTEIIAAMTRTIGSSNTEQMEDKAKKLVTTAKILADGYASLTTQNPQGNIIQNSVNQGVQQGASTAGSEQNKQSYRTAGQSLATATNEGVSIIGQYLGSTGAVGASSFVSGVQSGQIPAQSAANLMSQMVAQGAGSADLAAVAATLGGNYVNGIFSFNGQSYEVGSGVSGQSAAGMKSKESEGGNAGKSQAGAFTGGIRNLKGDSSSAGGELASAAASGSDSQSAKNTIQSSGKSIGDQFAAGIRSAIDGAKKAAKGIVEAILALFPHSPAKEGPLSGSGWTKLGLSGEAFMGQWFSGMSIGLGDGVSLVSDGISNMQSTLSSVMNYAYDDLEMKPVISPVIDTSAIDSVNWNNVESIKMGKVLNLPNIDYTSLNQKTLSAASQKYNIDTIVKGMDIMNSKLTDLTSRTDAQTAEIAKGHYPVITVDGKVMNKQLAPGAIDAQTAYANKMSRIKEGKLQTL